MSCLLQWYPYQKDRTMGLNHQSASLSCALGEAFLTRRTLVMPASVCLFALHTERWAAAGPGERCIPIGELYDIAALSKLVPIRLVDDVDSAGDMGFAQDQVAHVQQGWSSQRVEREHPCGASHATLVRRKVDTFWFSQCARRLTDYNGLAAELNRLVGAPLSASKPLNIILRSGLFFSHSVKRAASEIRMAIGGPYASLHVRRSDKLVEKSRTLQINGKTISIPAACNPNDCKERDRLTRPAAIDKSLRLWLPVGSHVYIGSTEPPSFFEPLRASFRLHFAEDFGRELSNITNNYALYAVETLLFFGSQASVESLGFQSGWFVDACFPAYSMRGSGGMMRRRFNTSMAARGAFAAAVDIQCRDASGILINGVLYGQACANNLPCGKSMHLAPQPHSCGQPPLPERLMLSNRTAEQQQQQRAKGGATRAPRCSSLSFESRRDIPPPRPTKRAEWQAAAEGGGGKGGGGGKSTASALGRLAAGLLRGGKGGGGGGGKGGGGGGGGGKGGGGEAVAARGVAPKAGRKKGMARVDASSKNA